MKPNISFTEYTEITGKLEMKIGRITMIQAVKKSKLLQLTVDFDEENLRIVLTNIGDHVETEELLNRKFAFITNVEPAIIKGIESQAVIVPGDVEKGFILYQEGPEGAILM
jgi:tRNA-binding EMAP/Myf-like protein